MTFPNNPQHGDTYSPASGVVYQYSSVTASWERIIVSDFPVQRVSLTDPGVMSVDDFKKINRILLPLPRTSLRSPACATSFTQGTIALHGGDEFVQVTGNADVRNGSELITLPFHVHQHTFAFDFTLNLNNLFEELDRRGQLNVKGKKGPDGPKGDQGDRGPDVSLTGPRGLKGEQGSSPPCGVSVQPEAITNNPRIGYNMVISDAEIVVNETDPSQYKLRLFRQTLANASDSATQFDFQDAQSPWMLAVQGNVGKQRLYYFDAGVIVDTIRDKFESEVARLKQGYEDVVKLWVQTMSDLFDQQKAALCCSLEFCKSKTNSIQVRQHMESVSATVTGKANAILHNRRDPEAALVSSTQIRKSINLPDVCDNGEKFPKAPTPEPASIEPLTIESAKFEAQKVNTSSYTMLVDAIANINSPQYGSKINLEAGNYVLTVDECCPQFGKKFTANNLIIQYNSKSGPKHTTLVDKGVFDDYGHASMAYTGLSTAVEHIGGEISLYFQVGVETQLADYLKIKITHANPHIANAERTINSDMVAKLQTGLKSKKSSSFCVNVSGQMYLVIKSKVFDPDTAVALPTFDCATIVDLGPVGLFADSSLNSIVAGKIANKEITNIHGSIAAIDKILFPST